MEHDPKKQVSIVRTRPLRDTAAFDFEHCIERGFGIEWDDAGNTCTFPSVLLRYTGEEKDLLLPPVKYIGSFALAENEAIEHATVTDATAQILPYAFADCTALRSVGFCAAGNKGTVSIGGSAFAGCYSLTRVLLPHTLAAIGDAAFTGCSSLEKLGLPDSVVSIGEAAFAGCTCLSITKLPKDLKVVESNVFSQVASVCDLPEGVLIIAESAFRHTMSESYYVPASVKYIGKDAFSGPCFKCIRFGGTEEEWNTIEIDKAGGWLGGIRIQFNCKRRN